MTKMTINKRPIHPIDFIFLSLEKRRQPMHVAGLLLFKIPEHASDNFVQELAEQIRANKQMPFPPFNQRLNGLYWQDDPNFDLDHHFRHIALPNPGRIRELFVYISQEHSALLDRAKPMWTCTLIEGIEGRRFALYFKIHHAMVDGVAGVRLLKKSLSSDPQQKRFVPLWCLNEHINSPSEQYQVEKRLKNPQPTLKSRLQQLWSSSGRVWNELSENLQDRKYNPEHVATFQAPPSILNQRVSSSRRFSAQSFELQRLRNIASYFDVKMNDVILAICSGALRQYLKQHATLPEKSLVAMVPASIREDDSDVSNRITMILASLATHLDEPVQRLYAIQRSVQHAKKRFSRMSSSEILNYSALVYGGVGLQVFAGIFPKHQSFNLVISSLIAYEQPLYLNGAVLDAIYPASIVLDGQALNITMGSYVDKLEVGIVACRHTLPKIQSLLKYLENSIVEYEQIINENQG